jgi:hypothetical protein
MSVKSTVASLRCLALSLTGARSPVQLASGLSLQPSHASLRLPRAEPVAARGWARIGTFPQRLEGAAGRRAEVVEGQCSVF